MQVLFETEHYQVQLWEYGETYKVVNIGTHVVEYESPQLHNAKEAMHLFEQKAYGTTINNQDMIGAQA